MSQCSLLHSQCNPPGESSVSMNSSRPSLRWMGYDCSRWKDLPYHLLLSTIIVTDTYLTPLWIWEPFLPIVSSGALAESVGQGHFTFRYRGVVTLNETPELPAWAAVLTSDWCYSKLPQTWGLQTMQMHSFPYRSGASNQFQAAEVTVLTGQAPSRGSRGLSISLTFLAWRGHLQALAQTSCSHHFKLLFPTSHLLPVWPPAPPLIRTHVIEIPRKFL